jgi:hypothetical protein
VGDILFSDSLLIQLAYSRQSGTIVKFDLVSIDPIERIRGLVSRLESKDQELIVAVKQTLSELCYDDPGLLLTQSMLEGSISFVPDVVRLLVNSDNGHIDALRAFGFHPKRKVVEITDDSVDLFLLRLSNDFDFAPDPGFGHRPFLNQEPLSRRLQVHTCRWSPKDTVVPSDCLGSKDPPATIHDPQSAPHMFAIAIRDLVREKILEQLPSNLVSER